MAKRLTSKEIEEEREERGSAYWREYDGANKVWCPENGIPLWQAVNPFSYGASETGRKEINEYVASHPFTRGFVRTTGFGFRYVSYGEERLTAGQIRDFRILTHASLPDNIRAKLSSEVTKKYGGLVSLSRAVLPFNPRNTRRLVNIIPRKYKHLLKEAIRQKSGQKRFYFFKPERLHGFRIKLFRALLTDCPIDPSSQVARIYGV